MLRFFTWLFTLLVVGATAPADLVISEVLFAVPSGDAGDATGDGVRSATGDEFIEIVNTGSRPVNLAGWVLSSRLSDPADDTGKGVRFVFPDVELPARGVAVVFNGNKTEIPGPVGSASGPASGPNDAFDGALVFTMRMTSSQRALRNSGDFVLLTSPSGRLVDCIWWGETDPAPPAGVLRIHEAPRRPAGSAQRVRPGEAPIDHEELDGSLFSPGGAPG